YINYPILKIKDSFNVPHRLFTTQEVFTEYLIDDDEFIHVIYDDEMLENVNHAVEEMNEMMTKNNIPKKFKKLPITSKISISFRRFV
ncbi:20880_t:CDS:1, partial [Gigaspora margarita]